MTKATGFEDDTIVPSETAGALELTEREKAIASGNDPDEVGAEDAEEEGDEAEGKEAAGKDDAASGVEGTDAPGSDWVDSYKELAESYGIDDETLQTFKDEAQFKLFGSLLDKKLAEVEAEAVKAEKPAKRKAKDAEPEDDALDIEAYETAGYDEDTLKIVKSVSKLQGTVKALLERNAELEQRLAEGSKQSIDAEIDKLGGRFGSGENLTRAQTKARQKLLDASEVVRQNLEKRGEKVSTSVLLRRAELVAFGDEILAEERAKQKEALTQSIKKQSAKRRPVGRNTKPPARNGRPGEAADPVKAIANSPEVVALWRSFQQD